MIKLLQLEDANSLRELRLQSLNTDPESFVSTFEFERQFSTNFYQHKIVQFKAPFGYWGIFVSELIGYCQLAPEYLPKLSHLANIYELYLMPKYRHQDHASTLLKHVINQARQVDYLEQIHLHVHGHNLPAINLYKKLGFEHIATRPQVIKEPNNSYQDELFFRLNLTK